jgi:flagellin-like protein
LRRNKKGLSEIVGYVLLIVFAISMSAIVYTFLKSSIPKPEVQCPDGVSIEISDYHFEPKSELRTDGDYLYLNITNRGLFGINGISVTLKNGSRPCNIKAIYCWYNPQLECTSQGNKLLFKQFLNQSMMKPIYIVYDASACNANYIELTPMRYSGNNIILCDNSIIKENIIPQ